MQGHVANAGRSTRSRGLVLLELLVAGCVLAVLAALAVPSFQALGERMKLRTAVEELTADLYAARAEAYRRGGYVTLASQVADECQVGERGSDWSCGWVAFEDDDEDGRQAAGEQLLFVGQPPRGIDISTSTRTSALKLNAWGQFNGLGALSFVLRSRGADELASTICISSGGRLRVASGKAGCS